MVTVVASSKAFPGSRNHHYVYACTEGETVWEISSQQWCNVTGQNVVIQGWYSLITRLCVDQSQVHQIMCNDTVLQMFGLWTDIQITNKKGFKVVYWAGSSVCLPFVCFYMKLLHVMSSLRLYPTVFAYQWTKYWDSEDMEIWLCSRSMSQ